MNKEARPLGKFVYCKCGVHYISGYLHCPKCGIDNPMDNRQQSRETHPSKG